MRKTTMISTVLALALATFSAGAQNGPVKAWEGTIDLPTYRVNAPEKAPLFERDFAYQRAKRGVYPYAMNDNPTNEKVDSTHRALFIENDYLKVCVLPDIGGRLFYATDKTNGYEIFYRQSVIKPANVGMLGAWISGGVEWNVFHHHRATSQYPIDYTIVDNGDGSKTLWVGEVENRHRMSWAMGMTLYPDKSYIEVTGRFFNNAQDRNSMLHWNNVATHANENYQIVFPECTDFGTFHHKNSFLRWPVPDGEYCGNPDYAGVDISYWKNLPALMGGSVFIYDQKDDFVGGYDYGKDAGTMLAGNHNINKGGKFWTWGHMNYGHSWDCEVLTDTDGAYVELMTGAYSDNQPDYCWINPHETKEFTAYWYGIRNLRHVNRGNELATLNMDIDQSGKIHVAANVTQIRNNAKVEVRKADGTLLYSKVAYIAPDKPFADDFTTDAANVAEPSEVTMTVYSAEGQELLSYHPYKLDRSKPLPEPSVKWENGVLTASVSDGADIYYRKNGGKAKPYASVIKTSEPEQYAFFSQKGTGRSVEVVAPESYEEICPKVHLTSTLPSDDWRPASGVENYERETHFSSAPRKGDSILFTFDAPVRCRKIEVRTGDVNFSSGGFTAGYVEVSYDGKHFHRVADLSFSAASFCPKRPVRAVRIVCTRDGNFRNLTIIQPLKLWI